jgi:hypothetical protein
MNYNILCFFWLCIQIKNAVIFNYILFNIGLIFITVNNVYSFFDVQGFGLQCGLSKRDISRKIFTTLFVTSVS